MRRERCAELAVGVAVDVAFDAARDDLLLAVVALGVGQQRRDQQRLLHHRSVHGVSFSGVGMCAGAVQACAAWRRRSRGALGIGRRLGGALHVGFVGARGEHEGAARPARRRRHHRQRVSRPQASDSTPAMNGPGGQAEQVLEQRQHRRAGGAHAGVDDVDHDRRHRADGAGHQEAAERDQRELRLRDARAEARRAEGRHSTQQRRRCTAAPSSAACARTARAGAVDHRAPDHAAERRRTAPPARPRPPPGPARCRARD